MKVLSKLKAEPGLWLSEEPVPTYGPHDVLIKIKKTAICGTDLHIYKWDDWAQKTVPVPMRIGHEFVGTIEAIGEEVKDFEIGDRVSGEGHITCGYCRNCRAGRRHLCRNTEGIGYDRPGVFAEYFAMPNLNVCKIPDDISDDEAAILDPFGNAVHATLEFDLVGEDVLITGAGPVGIMSAAVAKHAGARYVVITDINDYRLALAEKIGVTKAVNTRNTALKNIIKELKMTEGFDIALEMSGSPQAFQQILEALNYGGRISFLGIPSKNFAIDWSEVVFHSLKIHGIYGRRMFETWYKGIAMLQSGVNILPVITDSYPVDEYETAFSKMLSGESGKIILEW